MPLLLILVLVSLTDNKRAASALFEARFLIFRLFLLSILPRLLFKLVIFRLASLPDKIRLYALLLFKELELIVIALFAAILLLLFNVLVLMINESSLAPLTKLKISLLLVRKSVAVILSLFPAIIELELVIPDPVIVISLFAIISLELFKISAVRLRLFTADKLPKLLTWLASIVKFLSLRLISVPVLLNVFPAVTLISLALNN